MKTLWHLLICILAAATLQAAIADADPLRLAVASNFLGSAGQLADGFAASGHARPQIITGSTGKLYAQIQAGAPFDIFMSADRATPTRLVREGLADASSQFTYATGRLVLWSRTPDLITPDGVTFLRTGTYRRLAIASPDVAPYGAAAREALKNLDLWNLVEPRLVMAPNIGDVFLAVMTGNAEAGFVAASSLAGVGIPTGSRWEVPPDLHSPIEQDVVLLTRRGSHPDAASFLAYLCSQPAIGIITRSGYQSGKCKGNGP